MTSPTLVSAYQKSKHAHARIVNTFLPEPPPKRRPACVSPDDYGRVPRCWIAGAAWATKYGMKQTKEPSADAQASLGKQPHNSLPGGNELAPKMGVTEGAQTMTKDIEEQQVVEADQRRKQGQKETELIRNAMV